MEFNYRGQFNLTSNLATAISCILSHYEDKECVCRELNIIIPKHDSLIFISPINNSNSLGNGLLTLSGAQIQDINERYGKYVMGEVDEQTFSFIAIGDKSMLDVVLSMEFKSLDEIDRALKALSDIHYIYEGIFNSKLFVQRFLYLESFFNEIDEWREKTGRVTIDDDILNAAVKRCIDNKESFINKNKKLLNSPAAKK